MVTTARIKDIKKSIESHPKSGEPELVVLPRGEYDTLLQKIEDLQDIQDSIESLKEQRIGKRKAFEDYHARLSKALAPNCLSCCSGPGGA